MIRRARVPTPVLAALAGAGALLAPPAAAEIAAPKPLALIKADYPEGPIALSGGPLAGDLLVAEMTADRIRRVSRDGDAFRTSVFWREPGCGPTALAEIAGERLVVLCHIAGYLAILDRRGARTLKRIHRADDGARLDSPNDVHSDRRGGAFFSNAGVFSPRAAARGAIYRIAPDLSVRRALDGFRYANGVAVAADGATLFVSEHLARRFWRFRLGADGAPARPGQALGPDARGLGDRGGIVGPDGVEVLNSRARFVALYGAGRILKLVDGRAPAAYRVPQKYVTNVAVWGDLLAVVGADDVSRPPFAGAIALFRLEDF